MSEPNKSESTTTLKSPSECSGEELQAFCALVVQGGEVTAEGLLGRVKRAKTLAFRYEGDKLVGVAALKKPGSGYRRDVFDKAEAKLQADSFPLELGWVIVAKEHQSEGHSAELVEPLLRDAKTSAYATSKTINERMHKGLRRFGFAEIGKSYASKEHEGQNVALFVRARLGDE